MSKTVESIDILMRRVRASLPPIVSPETMDQVRLTPLGGTLYLGQDLSDWEFLLYYVERYPMFVRWRQGLDPYCYSADFDTSARFMLSALDRDTVEAPTVIELCIRALDDGQPNRVLRRFDSLGLCPEGRKLLRELWDKACADAVS